MYYFLLSLESFCTFYWVIFRYHYFKFVYFLTYVHSVTVCGYLLLQTLTRTTLVLPRPLGGLNGLLHMLNAIAFPAKVRRFLVFISYFARGRAKARCGGIWLAFYITFISALILGFYLFLCEIWCTLGVLLLCAGHRGTRLSWLQIQCKYKSNQKKFVKSRIGDELEHFKLESTYLEQIHRRYEVSKIRYEVQLKIEGSQKNLRMRFKTRTVFKPYRAV